MLSVERISTAAADGGARLDGVSLEIRRGEVLGIAGIDGQGQRHLAEAIAGQRPLTGGSIRFEGRDVTGESVRARQRRGIGYVTDDRLHEGIAGGLSVALNLVLKSIGERPFWRWGLTDRTAVAAEARRRIAELEIRPVDPEVAAGKLSGGNIQKLLLARELARDPRLVVFNRPTHGLDSKTVDRVRQVVGDFAANGGAALLISNELDELAALCDRIAVLSGGRLVATIENDGDRVAERLGESMAMATATAVGA